MLGCLFSCCVWCGVSEPKVALVCGVREVDQVDLGQGDAKLASVVVGVNLADVNVNGNSKLLQEVAEATFAKANDVVVGGLVAAADELAAHEGDVQQQRGAVATDGEDGGEALLGSGDANGVPLQAWDVRCDGVGLSIVAHLHMQVELLALPERLDPGALRGEFLLELLLLLLELNFFLQGESEQG